MEFWYSPDKSRPRLSKAKIEVYLDCNSPYSYYALSFLLRNQKSLSDHGVEIDVNPIFLGGVNVGSGNKPPWTLPAKAKYSSFDGPRAARYFGVEPFVAPPFFPILSVLPMRAMLHIKRTYPEALYHEVFAGLWQGLWREHKDLSKPEVLAETLGKFFHGKGEVEGILRAAGGVGLKRLLVDETARLVAEGAFGAPWFLVTDKEGKKENFFGSDRFAYMLQYLEVPFTDVEIQPRERARL